MPIFKTLLILYIVFCVILLVWVYFCVPETKGVRIEEMDKLFGGNQGESDMQRIAAIRQRLGLHGAIGTSSNGSEEFIKDKILETVQLETGTKV
jgi:hypothetical protein